MLAGEASRWLLRWWPAVLLGLATIGAYGSAYYAIGVLIPVIAGETGWPRSSLALGFSLGVLGQGGMALLLGRVLDRYGSGPVLLPSLIAGVCLLFAASNSADAAQFTIAWAIGGAIIGGGLYYNVTMPITTRLYPHDRATAFSILTLLGALASPIFYPLAASAVDLWGWRAGLQAIVWVTALCVAPAALIIRAPAASPGRGAAHTGNLLSALRRPAIYRVLLVFALVGFANSAVLLYQVSVFQAAGLSLAAASGFAGARGAFQIPGRLTLTPIIARLGVRRAITGCYLLASSATLALLVALGGQMPEFFALYYAAVGGVSLGLLSPLNGMFQSEVYGDVRLGTLSGIGVIVTSLASSAGAWLAGVAVDLTGSFGLLVGAAGLIQTLAVFAFRWQGAAPPETTG